MNLTGKQIAEQKIVTGFEEENIQQVGIDCRITGINKLYGYGFIPREGKTELPAYTAVRPTEDADQRISWALEPGYYEITLQEGCNIPNSAMLLLKQRSSLKRCGAEIESPVFDPGFKTEHMGTFMKVNHPVRIEYMARVCQAVVYETKGEVENLYEGQFQNDKQRANV